MIQWLNEKCPKIEIKEEEKKVSSEEKGNKEEEVSSNEDIEKVSKNTQTTKKIEYIRQKFIEIKKQLNEIEKKINLNRTKIYKKGKNRKIRIILEFKFINVAITVLGSLIIFAFYQTGSKIYVNSFKHKD